MSDYEKYEPLVRELRREMRAQAIVCVVIWDGDPEGKYGPEYPGNRSCMFAQGVEGTHAHTWAMMLRQVLEPVLTLNSLEKEVIERWLQYPVEQKEPEEEKDERD